MIVKALSAFRRGIHPNTDTIWGNGKHPKTLPVDLDGIRSVLQDICPSLPGMGTAYKHSLP